MKINHGYSVSLSTYPLLRVVLTLTVGWPVSISFTAAISVPMLLLTLDLSVPHSIAVMLTRVLHPAMVCATLHMIPTAVPMAPHAIDAFPLLI